MLSFWRNLKVWWLRDWVATGNRRWITERESYGMKRQHLCVEELDLHTGETRWVPCTDEPRGRLVRVVSSVTGDDLYS